MVHSSKIWSIFWVVHSEWTFQIFWLIFENWKMSKKSGPFMDRSWTFQKIWPFFAEWSMNGPLFFGPFMDHSENFEKIWVDHDELVHSEINLRFFEWTKKFWKVHVELVHSVFHTWSIWVDQIKLKCKFFLNPKS